MSTIISSLILFLFCFLFNGLIIRYRFLHEHLQSGKNNPQNVHSGYTPRLGGLPIYIGLVFHWYLQDLVSSNNLDWPSQWLIVLPLFLAGLGEDITHKVGIKVRFLAALVSGIMAFYFYKCGITRVDFPWVDGKLLTIPFISLTITCIAIAGLSNGYNLIDGLNGLASMVGIISLTAILYVAFKVGDLLIIRSSVTMIAMLIAFFIFNYPKGLLFLGDGGAYLVGFIIAINSILLVKNHPEVSAWFAVLVNAYPITETLFTIWRRFFHRHGNPALPDALHFHSLLYRRAMKWAMPSNSVPVGGYKKNAQTSPFLWLLSSAGIFPAVIFWNNPLLSQISTVFFVMIYIFLYLKIVRFKKTILTNTFTSIWDKR